MKHLDLFSGIGGFALAAKWAGMETIGFCEIDSFCQKVLFKHWPNVPIHSDIKTLKLYPSPYHVKIDLITAGLPCQPFSVAGKKRGKEDDRYLWPELLRVIREVKPTWIVAENVSGIVAMELDNIIDDLEAENYETQTFVIPACAANAPHRRDRVWIIAHLIGKRCEDGKYIGEKRCIQKDIYRNMEALYAEWEKCKPEPWQTMQARGFLALNAHASRIDDGLSSRLDRLKSLGNAIVPQVVYPILLMINEIEKGDKNERLGVSKV